MTTSVAISPCPNDTFTFGYWLLGLLSESQLQTSVEYLDIQELNQRALADDGPDVIKFSYALWPRIKANYRLSPVGSALGMGVGPLLVGKSSTSLDSIQKVLVPGRDTTAFQLFQRYAGHLPWEEERYDRILSRCCSEEGVAGVIIHESRFTYGPLGLDCLLDLGQTWEEELEVPLPLGGIAIHRRVPELRAQEIVAAIGESLQRAWKAHAPLLSYMREHAQEMSESVMLDHIGLYVNEHSAHLDVQAQRAICALTGEEKLDVIVAGP